MSNQNTPISQFLALPPELTELTLVFAAALGFPDTIAAVAQTCRALRTLVYGAADQHLWREVFLATFDDPRLAERVDKFNYADYQVNDRGAEESLGRKDELLQGFDWGAEFRRHLWAKGYIRRCTSVEAISKTSPDPHKPPLGLTPETMESNLSALDSLISLISSALPFPPTIVFSFISDSPSPSPPSAFTFSTQRSYPVFPPSRSSYVSGTLTTHGTSEELPKHCHGYMPSQNIRWFEDVISRGFPPALISTISWQSFPGGKQGVWESEMENRVMRALGRLIACVGFIPVPQVSISDGPAGGSAIVSEACETERTVEESNLVVEPSDIEVDTETPPDQAHQETTTSTAVSEASTESSATSTGMDEESQKNRARRIARMRVYNMRYLSCDRHWGPYLLPSDATSSPDKILGNEDDFLNPILAIFQHHEAGHPHEDDDDDSDSDTDDENGGLQVTGKGPPSLEPPCPHPSQLRADWMYLGAVRIVVEANLREAVNPEELNGLIWLDGLRRGSAPREMGCENDEDGEMPMSHKGKGKAKEIDREFSGGVSGWDWAGVAGIWRRCVCWMDYRDLILHNLAFLFSDPSLQEAVRIVPMRLRVASYSPCEIPGYSNRPTIHVEGETAGPAGSSTSRRVRGTVGMIGDGSIRWILYSSEADDGPDEWVTEGIQIGKSSSGMGVLGMWTGAQHERMDPLGPFWAWKVG